MKTRTLYSICRLMLIIAGTLMFVTNADVAGKKATVPVVRTYCGTIGNHPSSLTLATSTKAQESAKISGFIWGGFYSIPGSVEATVSGSIRRNGSVSLEMTVLIAVYSPTGFPTGEYTTIRVRATAALSAEGDSLVGIITLETGETLLVDLLAC